MDWLPKSPTRHFEVINSDDWAYPKSLHLPAAKKWTIPWIIYEQPPVSQVSCFVMQCVIVACVMPNIQIYHIYLFSFISYCRGHSSLSCRSWFSSFLLIFIVRGTKSMTVDLNVLQPEGKYCQPMNWRNYRNAILPKSLKHSHHWVSLFVRTIINALMHFVDYFVKIYKETCLLCGHFFVFLKSSSRADVYTVFTTSTSVGPRWLHEELQEYKKNIYSTYNSTFSAIIMITVRSQQSYFNTHNVAVWYWTRSF